MLVRRLWSHLHGYVIIRANGRRLKALINSAVRAGIPCGALSVRRTHLLVAGRSGDFSRLARQAAGLAGASGRLEKARRAIWSKWAGPRRPALVLGGAFSSAALYWLGQFVWFVHVDGAQTLATADVLRAAERAGLHPGAARHAVRRESVERTLHLELPDLAWAAVELRGTVATVRVVERTGADPSLTQPGHVVAVRDGIVERVSVTAGEALVAPGDTVQAGMPLISGVLTPGSEGYEERCGPDCRPWSGPRA